MKQTISLYDFISAFQNMNREDNFSYEGLGKLFEYLIDYEESCDTEIELDVIALCCDYTEYKNLEEFQKEYGSFNDMGDIESETIVIMIDDKSFIIQDY